MSAEIVEQADWLDLEQIERRLCVIAEDVSGIPADKISPDSRVIQDLHCDSINFLDLIFRTEKEFKLRIPDQRSDAVVKSLFTRNPLRLRDLAEMAFVFQGNPPKKRRSVFSRPASRPLRSEAVFCQLGGGLANGAGPRADEGTVFGDVGGDGELGDAVSLPRSLRTLEEIEVVVCDIASKQLGLRRSEVHGQLRLIDDLNFDSLDVTEFLMNVEDAFACQEFDDRADGLCKAVFTRSPARLCDVAEVAYMYQHTLQQRQRANRRRDRGPLPPPENVFCQLGGSVSPERLSNMPRYEKIGKNAPGLEAHRRRIDGMLCVRVPAAKVKIGGDDARFPDEMPPHVVELDEFLIDKEPVSTTAYCRFLNSVGAVGESLLREWFVLGEEDHRRGHEVLQRCDGGWQPIRGCERMPMVLVSWFGANAYSLWANRRDWKEYRDDSGQSFLPSEAQWEYAARAGLERRFPWGDEEPTDTHACVERHVPGTRYKPHELPASAVNATLGMSPFGINHMAGNVWQWCRDWYDAAFYRRPEASAPNSVQAQMTGVRSERGGSWVGAAYLARSAYRRGRDPAAKGRCLGFRCVGLTAELG